MIVRDVLDSEFEAIKLGRIVTCCEHDPPHRFLPGYGEGNGRRWCRSRSEHNFKAIPGEYLSGALPELIRKKAPVVANYNKLFRA